MKKFYGVYSDRGLGTVLTEEGYKMPLIVHSKKVAEKVALSRTKTHKRKHAVKVINIR